MAQRGYWRELGGTAVSASDALDAWARVAYPHLVSVAGIYHRVITYGELGDKVQQVSGIRTSALLHNWIGPVLGKVVREAHRRGDPALTSLVVHSDDGRVGAGYKEVLAVAGEPPIDDIVKREEHAAGARLLCYRRFAVDLPADGGVPALAPKLQATIARQTARSSGFSAQFCPRCFVQLPSTGVCDSCA